MQAFGWATIAGFSAVFAVLALLFVWAEKRVDKTYRVNSAEQFNTAGRQVGTGRGVTLRALRNFRLKHCYGSVRENETSLEKTVVFSTLQDSHPLVRKV